MTVSDADRVHCTFGPVGIDYDSRVLEPRGWTLLQSEWAAELAPHLPDGPILELCAGAGQIGLAAAVLSGRRLVQVDADAVAVEFARRNAARTGRHEDVDVRHGRIDDALLPAERFPIVLADPPYLPSADVTHWPHDPASAIDGGDDGLDLIRACLRAADEHLDDGGVLLLQVAGAAQARTVRGCTMDHLTWQETREHDRERAVMSFVCRR